MPVGFGFSTGDEWRNFFEPGFCLLWHRLLCHSLVRPVFHGDIYAGIKRASSYEP